MYSIRTTSGFVIDSRPFGDAGKVLFIFTRDMGLIMATAQGIRLEKSKLRYHSQNYTFGTFSFVRGKEMWRLTSAADSHSRGDTSGILVRIASLLKRVLNGEEPHPELFDIVSECDRFLNETPVPDLSRDQMAVLESIVVYLIMQALGYVGADPELSGLNLGTISIDLLNQFRDKRTIINRHINKAFKESQL